MKHTPFATFRFALLSAALLGSLPLRAADTVEAHWTEVCRIAASHTLRLSTADGATLEGYCVGISADEITINTKDRGIVKVGRSKLSRVYVHLESSNRGHELEALGRGMKMGLTRGVGWLFSPAALVGIVTIPATLAWGAAAAPFCAIGDLADKITHGSEKEREIKVI